MVIHLSSLHLSSIQMATCEEGDNEKVAALQREAAAAWTQSGQGEGRPALRQPGGEGY